MSSLARISNYYERMSSTVGPRWLLAVHGEEVLVAVGVETGGRDLR